MKDAAFSSARLLELYERISDAEDAIPHLRRFVLDLAVRGKLVEQDTAEECASELMKRANALKDEEGVKTKADPMQGDDIPFPAPLGWIWTRLGEIALQTGSGSTPRGGKSAYSDDGTPFLRSQNIYDDGLQLDDVVFINDETNEKMKRTKVKPKDLLLNITGGSIGRCTRIPDEFSGANVSQHVAIIRTAAPSTEDYLHLLVRSPFFQSYVLGEQTGAGRGGLPKNRMDRIPVPLPPLAEQHRIVAKVDELMALCDRLEETRTSREGVRDKLTAASLARLTAPDTSAADFQSHARFALQSLPALTSRPDQIKSLRQAILNLAVRGKLVAQDAADEPADKLMARIRKRKDEDVEPLEAKRSSKFSCRKDILPFTLPPNWSVAALRELSYNLGDGLHGTPNYISSGDIYFINGTNLRNGRIEVFTNTKKVSDDEFAKHAKPLSDRTLLVSINGTLTNYAFYNGERVLLGKSACYFEISPLVEMQYIRVLIQSPYYIEYAFEEATGATIKNLSLKAMNGLPVPLPPLAEQHRIVAKVDALMALCDRLEASLITADTTRQRLLTTLLHEALEPTAGTVTA